MNWEGLAADSRGQWQRSWASQQQSTGANMQMRPKAWEQSNHSGGLTGFPSDFSYCVWRGVGGGWVCKCATLPHTRSTIFDLLYPITPTHTHISTLPSHPHPKSQQLEIPVIPSVLSRVRLFVTVWTVACQAPLSMGFFGQEHWSGLPFPPPGDLPDAGIETASPALAGRFFITEPPGKPPKYLYHQNYAPS